MEAGETPAIALIREIGEELELELEPNALSPAGFAQGWAADGTTQLVLLLYTCNRWSGTPRAVEGGSCGWFTPAEIAGLPRPPMDETLCDQLFSKTIA